MSMILRPIKTEMETNADIDNNDIDLMFVDSLKVITVLVKAA